MTDKERILKTTREKQEITYKGIPIRLSAHLSAETLLAKREGHDIFQVMKGEKLQPRMIYPGRPSFRSDGEIKSRKSSVPSNQFYNKCEKNFSR